MAVSGTWYLSGLWPPFAGAVSYLLDYCAYLSYEGRITSGFRTWAEQAVEYAKGRTLDEIARQVSKVIGVGGVVSNAPPGRSAHNYGLAVDVEGRDQAAIVQLARYIGFGTVTNDPAHIEWPNWRALLG